MPREKTRTQPRYLRCFVGHETIDSLTLEKNRERYKSAALVDCRYIGRTINCDFDGSVFIGCDLRACDFTGSSFRNVTMEECDLRGAIFDGCDMTSVTCDSETKWPLGFDEVEAGVAVLECSDESIPE